MYQYVYSSGIWYHVTVALAIHYPITHEKSLQSITCQVAMNLISDINVTPVPFIDRPVRDHLTRARWVYRRLPYFNDIGKCKCLHYPTQPIWIIDACCDGYHYWGYHSCKDNTGLWNLLSWEGTWRLAPTMSPWRHYPLNTCSHLYDVYILWYY